VRLSQIEQIPFGKSDESPLREKPTLEIIALLVLGGLIGDMARRRERTPSLFQAMLVLFWFGGEIAGGVLTYVLAVSSGPAPNLLLIYAGALAGAVCGAASAFVLAKSFGPLNGEWKNLAELPVRRSRLLGAVVGGVGGGVLGAALVKFMYGNVQTEGNLPIVLQGFLAVGIVGALLGLVSGVQKE
jgi:hypothetical protein